MSDKPSLLVVGQDSSQESVLTGLLLQQLNIVHADNADQVIDITSDNENPDLVLLDAIALGDKAYETCMWLKTDDEVKNIPIMVLGEPEGNIQSWLAAGAVDYISPATLPELALARIKSQLELKYKTGLLAKIASLDELTALVNQHRLDEYLDIEWRRSLREFYPISLIKIDIDFFAAFNDNYGIGSGDEVLKRIARALSENINRAADMISRYSADEFVVLLPSLELENALALAERMVDSVLALDIAHDSSTYNKVTVSAGVATIEPSRDKRGQDLFDEVEEMLFQAQQSGGNQAMGIVL
jgi:diguanylate cyclase (GGDEF)-like protein